jgi:hypothetical protein
MIILPVGQTDTKLIVASHNVPNVPKNKYGPAVIPQRIPAVPQLCYQPAMCRNAVDYCSKLVLSYYVAQNVALSHLAIRL